ncbi:hypothetical protein GCM10009687_14980 [Asanoa iriomotensis]|uniref:Uncharacterized protein n=1 Tax=Asanoa iriomotensis TaxID=234613 RepID=A0ABQ4CGF5_9ACTN|nr:hypothetical protein Air01nite_79490 [Asanoa iriomotensis]
MVALGAPGPDALAELLELFVVECHTDPFANVTERSLGYYTRMTKGPPQVAGAPGGADGAGGEISR